MFVFNMQFLWKYIDEIAGKGIEAPIIAELLFYQALAMMPQAMVFGVLVGSVMTMGNMAEHHELTSMKSAGMSIFRVMRPLIFFCFFLSGISFLFSNTIIPFTALKFKSILYDIRRKKPALSFDKGQFNDDFKDVALFVGDKSEDGTTLYDLKIYDHRTPNGYQGQTNASTGKLFFMTDTTQDKIQVRTDSGKLIPKDTAITRRYLVVKLENGVQYQETEPKDSKHPLAYPEIKMHFEEYTTMFDLTQFDFNETNEDLFKGHYSLLTTKQLLHAVDSLEIQRNYRLRRYQLGTDGMFHFRRTGAIVGDTSPVNKNRPLRCYYPDLKDRKAYNIVLDASITNFDSLIPAKQRVQIHQRAQSFAQNMQGQSASFGNYIKGSYRIHANYENEVHQKLSFAFACLLFLFIGGPLGAIIRKGGFGWPIMVSIIFFILFFMLYTSGQRLAKKGEIICWIGSWLPNLSLAPIGLLFTYTAFKDARLANLSQFKFLLDKLLQLFNRKKNADKADGES